MKTRQVMYVLRNTDVYSCNLCCSGKESKYDIFVVCICRLRYPACNARALYCHLWPAPLYNIFPTYLVNGGFSKKNKVLNIKCVVLIQCISKTFLNLRGTERHTIKNMY